MRYCAGCHKIQFMVYLHHGKLLCGLCLDAEPHDDVLVRCRLARIKVATYRALVRGESPPMEPLPLPRAQGRFMMSDNSPVVGCIDVEYPEGTRSFLVMGGRSDLALAQTKADDIWEEYQGRLRVRVYRFFVDGGRTCICHLPPL
jgi:hypothetical protein